MTTLKAFGRDSITSLKISLHKLGEDVIKSKTLNSTTIMNNVIIIHWPTQVVFFLFLIHLTQKYDELF